MVQNPSPSTQTNDERAEKALLSTPREMGAVTSASGIHSE